MSADVKRIAVDSPQAWARLAVSVALSAIGGVGMWSVVVTLPAVQADFGVARAEASLPYTLAMLAFAFGGVAMGRIVDRRGPTAAIVIGAIALALGYALSAMTSSFVLFALFQGVFVGFGASAMFAPLIADISHYFAARRGIAVSICAAGNYLAGVVWPPLVQFILQRSGWRAAHVVIAIVCGLAIPSLALLLRNSRPAQGVGAAGAGAARPLLDSGLSKGALQTLLVVAGFACCVAMSMPQAHIVAYCGDLGYGPARGADMLSLMLGFGIVSRVASGYVADRIGGVRTLLIGSFLQGVALLLYLMFDGLNALYVISALFGLFQGGIVPSYAIIIREYFDPQEAGSRVGLVVMATLFGMAFGGWVSGVIFDWTGGYRPAFANGAAWNLLNLAVCAILLARRGKTAPA